MAMNPAMGPGRATPNSSVIMPDDTSTHLRNRISWGAIVAGLVAALVVQLLLNVLGIGIGMSSISAASMGDNPGAAAFSLKAGLWWTLSGIAASLAGGIVAGRLCGTSDDNTARWHGLIAWATATLVVFYLLTSALGGLLGGTLGALGSTLGGAGKAAASAATGLAGATDGDALQAQMRRLVNPNDAQSVQDSVVGYIRSSLNGDTAGADAARDRAVDGLAKVANISPEEARTRLTQAEQQARQAADTAKQKATQVAEATRKGVAKASILGAIALAIGALAAWFGGRIGAPKREVRTYVR